MLKLSLLLLTLASTLAQSQVDLSCPQRDIPYCSWDHELNFDDLPATEGLLLSTPNACLESYGKLGWQNFSVFSLPQLTGAGSTHLAGFQLGSGTHQITRGEGMEIFYPFYFNFLCALPTLALGVAASMDCTIRVTPTGTGLEGQAVECEFVANGGLLSPIVPAHCDLPFAGPNLEAFTIEVVQPAVLNTLYAFGINYFKYVDLPHLYSRPDDLGCGKGELMTTNSYRDECWGRKIRGRGGSRSGARRPAAGSN